MKDFFCELLAYHHQLNQQLVALLISNASIVSSKTTELFSHSLNAHQIWNSRILANQKPFSVWQVHEISAYKSMDQSNYEISLAIIQNYELDEVVTYQTSKGEPFANSIRDILFHIVNHTTYHRAQIATELKGVGIIPPSADWIMYKR